MVQTKFNLNDQLKEKKKLKNLNENSTILKVLIMYFCLILCCLKTDLNLTTDNHNYNILSEE